MSRLIVQVTPKNKLAQFTAALITKLGWKAPSWLYDVSITPVQPK